MTIKCGINHSYCRTKSDYHYLWGNNECNECTLCINNDYTNDIHVFEPYLINEIVAKLTDNKIIHDVYLGNRNTKIIVYK